MKALEQCLSALVAGPGSRWRGFHLRHQQNIQVLTTLHCREFRTYLRYLKGFPSGSSNAASILAASKSVDQGQQHSCADCSALRVRSPAHGQCLLLAEVSWVPLGGVCSPYLGG